MKRATIKWQLIRDGELYNTVYDSLYDAIKIGYELKQTGFIRDYHAVAVKAIWLSA
jgi:hypothetical protein